jgi:DNA ligase 1
MRAFAALNKRLDQSTGQTEKRAALSAYFRTTPAADAVWALRLLTGGKIGGAKARIAASAELRQWLADRSGLPQWLIEESHDHVGDLAETVTLLICEPAAAGPEVSLHVWIEERLLQVANAPAAARREVVTQAWSDLRFDERLVFNKLLTGSLRVGVSEGLVRQVLSEISGVDIARISQRLLGDWPASEAFFQGLLSPDTHNDDPAQALPFYLASPLEGEPSRLGAINDWLLEWKWDGIRLQLIRRGGRVALWSRGEERLDGRFPEIEGAALRLPADVVLDGELLAWGQAEAVPRPFAALQPRIQLRKPSAQKLASAPVRFLAYDMLELGGEDLRTLPLETRRARLADLIQATGSQVIALSPQVQAYSWEAAAALRAQARERGVEGLMLKRRTSAYLSGRRRGDWWKWKVDPLTVDAVLLYAQAGHGRRSTLFTDYTFGLWRETELVPVAKAYSGLSDAEILKLDHWIRANTVERFGPVRSVRPHHVFELGFEAVNRSGRHKSGVAVRFPRILRWRTDKSPADADRIEALHLLAQG